MASEAPPQKKSVDQKGRFLPSRALGTRGSLRALSGLQNHGNHSFMSGYKIFASIFQPLRLRHAHLPTGVATAARASSHAEGSFFTIPCCFHWEKSSFVLPTDLPTSHHLTSPAPSKPPRRVSRSNPVQKKRPLRLGLSPLTQLLSSS